MLELKIKEAVAEYEALKSRLPINVIHTEEEYSRAVALLDEILDEIGEDEDHRLADLAETISVFIEAYDDEHHRIPKVSGVEALRFLMEQHDLTQSDLPEIGAQSVVSAILSGKRHLNLRQLIALSQRFAVPIEVFTP